MKSTIRAMQLSLWCIAVSSLSLICVTFADFNGNGFQRFAAYFTGVVFWVFFIAGYILFFIVSKKRKADKKAKLKDKRPGIVRFFTNQRAKIFDIAMLAVIVLLVVFLFIPNISVAVRIILVALLVLSVQMHCILNGVNYRYIRLLTEGEPKMKERIA